MQDTREKITEMKPGYRFIKTSELEYMLNFLWFYHNGAGFKIDTVCVTDTGFLIISRKESVKPKTLQ